MDKARSYSPIENRILQAAERLFAEHGFRGTSLRDITDAAECNVAAVNYHFHGKENLYIAVFQRHMKAIAEERYLGLQGDLTLDSISLTLERFLRAFTKRFIRPFLATDQGDLTSRLVIHEHQDPHLPQKMFYDEVVDPLRRIVCEPLMALCPYLTTEQANQCMNSLVGQLLCTLHAQILFAGTDENKMPVLNIERTLEHIIRFTAAGICQCNKQ